ncbi:MAG: hypothetical protein ACOCY6_05140 [Halodesulfurarchaeum sp.]
MKLSRRDFARLGGLTVGVSLTGCLGASKSDEGPTIADHSSAPLAVRSTRPAWEDEETIGWATLLDSATRTSEVLDSMGVDEPTADASELLETADFDTERVLVVESAGPSACHRRLEFGEPSVESDESTPIMSANTAVRSTGDEDEACATVLAFPSALLSVRFDGDPIDTAEVLLEDGWDETALLAASVEDPL